MHVFSLSEKGARDAHLSHRDALFAHNRTSLMRIYPVAYRVSSSNLDPSFYWRCGAQMAALNWQYLDKGMMLNHGMFNGTQGWTVKPPGYRSLEPVTNVVKRVNLQLSIEIFAGQDLSLPSSYHNERGFHPYVNCQLHVEEPNRDIHVGQDEKTTEADKSRYKRWTKSSSGKNPDFKAQKLVFPTVSGIVEELSFIRFVFAFILMLSSSSCLLLSILLLQALVCRVIISRWQGTRNYPTFAATSSLLHTCFFYRA